MKVSYDSRAIKINGKRTILLSGSIHYPRSTPEMWPSLMKFSREAGLNTVETYVFWNLHEKKKGVFDFSGRLNLRNFCNCASENGLHVILRVGPYICAETNYGGFPAWLRDIPGMQMRTFNQPFMREMKSWISLLCNYMKDLFATNGGPIILWQLENEYDLIAKNYGEGGKKYLEWVVELSKELKISIPLIMCVGAAPGAIETINNSYGHNLLAKHFSNHPEQPALWTEAYPGWYNTYGYPRNTRTPENIAYAAARFFAEGGTGIIYYMWHGGTNFGRETMFLQTTSYDFDAPLDEFGYPTTKYYHLKKLHFILKKHVDIILDNKPDVRHSSDKTSQYVYKKGQKFLCFLCNDDAESSSFQEFQSKRYKLLPRTVVLISEEGVLMNTSVLDSNYSVKKKFKTVSNVINNVEFWAEPMPDKRKKISEEVIISEKPVEQLKLTQDTTDYCWYTTEISISKNDAGKGILKLKGVADIVYVFVDGNYTASTSVPLLEHRGPIDEDGFNQSFSINLAKGKHNIAFLCCAIGLIKGDWMLGYQNMVEEKKGLWGNVYWNDKEIFGKWKIYPGLIGEKCKIFSHPGILAKWNKSQKEFTVGHLTWNRMFF